MTDTRAMPCQNVIDGKPCPGGYSFKKDIGLITCVTCGHVKP